MVGWLMKRLGDTTITIVRAPLVADTDNTLYRDWANATYTDIPFCMFQPFQLSSRLQIQDNFDREYASSFFRLWFPGGTDIDAHDRIIVNGRNLDIWGIPGPWYDFAGVETHITCLCKEREG